jgi:uncharacterized protein YndB with AHSA1/START domain
MRMLEVKAVRHMRATPDRLYRALTEEWGTWFARPASVVMDPVVGKPFYFDVEVEDARYPHYGRFLELEPVHAVQLTWVTGPLGTKGAETIVTFDLQLEAPGTRLELTHSGFVDQESRDGHEQAWPVVLAHLDEIIA